MAEANTPATANAGDDHEVFRAGAGRRLVFSVIFVLLLPFFLSLGPMLFWRLFQGQWFGTISLMILAVGFSIIMFLIVFELLFSIRSEVRLGPNAVKLTLPSGRGATPMLRYETNTVPYSDVDSVEVRREVYRNRIAPVTMKGARIKLKDGRYIKLGYVNEANADECLPFLDIGKKIAARAGVPIVDGGYVLRSVRAKVSGERASGDALKPISAAQIAEINRKHQNFMLGLVGMLVVLVGLGMFASDRDHRLDLGSVMTLFGTTTPPPAE